jgi:hypothetical protein
MSDHGALLEEILGEADRLIRERLEAQQLKLPHLVLAVTADSKIVLRSNVSADVLRSFGKDLIEVADELECAPATADEGAEDAIDDILAQRRLEELGRLLDEVKAGRMSWLEMGAAMDAFDRKERN